MLDRAGLLTDDIGRTIYDLLLEEDLLDLNVISIGAQLDARRQTGGSKAALDDMNSRRVLDRRQLHLPAGLCRARVRAPAVPAAPHDHLHADGDDRMADESIWWCSIHWRPRPHLR